MSDARELLGTWEESAATYLNGGKPYQAGARLVQAKLAKSLRAVAAGGRDEYYRGSIAREMVRYLREKDGVLTEEDFAVHRSSWTSPIRTQYRGFDVFTFPPNSQGLALLEILNIMAGFEVAEMGDTSAPYVHAAVEATKLAFADRERWVTDPEFLPAPLDDLLSSEYAGRRRSLIDPARAMQEPDAGIGTPPRRARGDTIYLCAVDPEGNAVSLIQSLFDDFGSGVVAGETGILMQNRGTFFSLDPEHPNRLDPGKRTMHTLMPSMIFRDSRLQYVVGSMGGEGQPQIQTALITRLLDFGFNVQEAIEAPRWVYMRDPVRGMGEVAAEARLGEKTLDALARMGHRLSVLGDWDELMGHAQAIRVDSRSGVLEGGADPRGDGAAIGW